MKLNNKGELTALSARDIEDEAVALLETTRETKRKQVVLEAVSRIQVQLPEINTLEEVQFLATLWPVLDTANAPTTFTNARDIYLYAKSKLTQVNGSTQTQLDNYDPLTDPAWPA